MNTKDEPFLIYKIFYFFMAFDIIRDTLPGITSIFLRKDIHFIFPIALSFLENTNKILDSGILILLCIPVIIYTLTNLHLQFSRILFFLYYFISKGFWFSSSRYSHQYLPHIWVLICLSISPDWGSELEKKVHRFVYRACLISISIFYFYPGAWKLFLGIQQGALAKIDYGANTIAFYLESHGKGSLFAKFLIDNPALTYLGFVSIIFFQISSLYAAWNPNYQRLWALGMLFFHLASVFAVDVNFFIVGSVAFLFFFLAPNVDRENDWLAQILARAKLLKLASQLRLLRWRRFSNFQ